MKRLLEIISFSHINTIKFWLIKNWKMFSHKNVTCPVKILKSTFYLTALQVEIRSSWSDQLIDGCHCTWSHVYTITKMMKKKKEKSWINNQKKSKRNLAFLAKLVSYSSTKKSSIKTTRKEIPLNKCLTNLKRLRSLMTGKKQNLI